MAALPSAAALVAPDQTALDLFRLLRSSRVTLPCLDQHLPGQILSPGHTVVLHGEVNSGKSLLLRNLLASHLLPPCCGGHGVPAVLIDAEQAFDVFLLAKLLQERVRRKCSEGSSAASGDLVQEALGRLLVFRPAEPLELLQQLQRLRQIFKQNPTAGLLVIDSMSAWHSMTAAFPKSCGSTLKECWRSVQRLQREASVAAVISHRDGPLEFPLDDAIHLGVGCCSKVTREEPMEVDGDDARRDEGGAMSSASQRDCFYLAPWGKAPAEPATEQTFFVISPVGEVESVDAVRDGEQQLVAVAVTT